MDERSLATYIRESANATTGAPFPALEGVSNNPRAGGDYTFSQDGTFAFLPGAENP
jgi:hypothetical protein